MTEETPVEETTSVEETTTTEELEPTPTLEAVTVHAAYVVVINRDGSLSTTVVQPAGIKPITVERVASVFDVLQSSKELVSDIEGQILADRVAKRVLASMAPVDEDAEAKARIAQALADRKSA